VTENGRIAILIPFKNEQNFIERCLLSVQSQTLGNFIVLMSDNNSTDNSASVAEKFQNSDNRFVLFKQAQSVSVGTNWNSLVAILENYDAEYVMWLSADDYIEGDDYLQDLVFTAENSPEIDCFIPKFMNISQGGVLNSAHIFETTIHSSITLIRKINLANKWANCVSLYGLYRRSTFDFLSKSLSSRILDAPESDWWWTFTLTDNFRSIGVRSSTYVKTIKDIPYYQRPQVAFGKQVKQGLNKNSRIPFSLLVSIKSRSVNKKNQLTIYVLVPIICFRIVLGKLVRKSRYKIVR